MKLLPRPKPLKARVEEELYEAQCDLLKAETALEWAQACVEYNNKRIVRLKQRLQELTPHEPD